MTRSYRYYTVIAFEGGSPWRIAEELTLRGLDPQLAAKLRDAAEKARACQTALDALRKQFGLGKSRRFTEVHRDLDHLFGRWDEEEFARIQRKIDSGRRVDPELWQGTDS